MKQVIYIYIFCLGLFMVITEVWPVDFCWPRICLCQVWGPLGRARKSFVCMACYYATFETPTPLDTPLDPNPNPTVPQAETISQPMSGWGCHNTVAQQSLAVAIGQTPSREPSQYPATVIEPSSEPF